MRKGYKVLEEKVGGARDDFGHVGQLVGLEEAGNPSAVSGQNGTCKYLHQVMQIKENRIQTNKLVTSDELPSEAPLLCFLFPGSEDSYSAAPVLPRDLGWISRAKPCNSWWSHISSKAQYSQL